MLEIPSTPETVRVGYLDPTAATIAEVASGTTVSYVNTWTHWGNGATYGMNFAEREPLRHQFPKGPFSMVGPVSVTDAQVGDTLEIKIKKLRPISWGWNSFPLGVGALPADFTEPYLHYFKFNEARTHTHFVKGVSFPLKTFLGYVALEPAGDEETSGNFAGKFGGNLIYPDLGVGTSLFLPVLKPGGRLWISNVNARQAGGVVDQTGIETAAERIDLELSLHKTTIDFPIVETPTHWVVFGFSDDNLDEALVNAVRNVISWLSGATDLDKSEVYALSSMLVNFEVNQYANQTHSAYATKPPKAVQALIPRDVFDQHLQAQINISLRGVAKND
ncbi:acetamidase/formamidase family protein [Enterococcus sp. LJL90]